MDLEAAGILVGVRISDRLVRIVASEWDARAALDVLCLYSPQDMLSYIQLDEHGRRLMRELKQLKQRMETA